MLSGRTEINLQNQISKIAKEAGAQAVAAAYYDYETDTFWSYHGERWFHAASTIKVALLVAIFQAIEEGRFELESRVHVRNRFISIVDGEAYRIDQDRDANDEVHRALGRTMRVRELARHMIATSSNLATNLLAGLVGIENARKTISDLDVKGIDLRRGVEDQKAFERGVNNMVTANGLVSLFRIIQEERVFSPDASRGMLDILHQQEFRSGIPAGLPGEVRETARIAHKTGGISTVSHDTGIVYLPSRKPYALAILTEWESNGHNQHETVARISRSIYEHLDERR